MGEPKPALYAASVTALGFVCLALACFTAIVPIWGKYEDSYGGYSSERGYFGPWKVCKTLNYGREVCGEQFTRFRVPSKFNVQTKFIIIVVQNNSNGNNNHQKT